MAIATTSLKRVTLNIILNRVGDLIVKSSFGGSVITTVCHRLTFSSCPVFPLKLFFLHKLVFNLFSLSCTWILHLQSELGNLRYSLIELISPNN